MISDTPQTEAIAAEIELAEATQNLADARAEAKLSNAYARVFAQGMIAGVGATFAALFLVGAILWFSGVHHVDLRS